MTVEPQTWVDWSAVRADFPALEHWTYLNTATYGHVPRRSATAIARHFAHRDELACSDFLAWYDESDRIRASIARLINATPDDIAFIPNSATALGLIAGGIDWKPGDNVVTLADEFPNQLYVPALIEHRGVEFREAPWEKFYDSIDARTRLVVISEVNYATGFRAPIGEISQIIHETAHERGARLYVDGTQSTGALIFDVQKSRPDVLAVHAYKWMLLAHGRRILLYRAGLPPADSPQFHRLAQSRRLAQRRQSASRLAGLERFGGAIRRRRSCLRFPARHGRVGGLDARDRPGGD